MLDLKRRDSRTVKRKQTEANVCSGLDTPTVMSISGSVGEIRIWTMY